MEENGPETGRSLEEVPQYVRKDLPSLQAIPCRALGEAGAAGQAVCPAVQSHFCTGDRGSPIECYMPKIEGWGMKGKCLLESRLFEKSP